MDVIFDSTSSFTEKDVACDVIGDIKCHVYICCLHFLNTCSGTGLPTNVLVMSWQILQVKYRAGFEVVFTDVVQVNLGTVHPGTTICLMGSRFFTSTL